MIQSNFSGVAQDEDQKKKQAGMDTYVNQVAQTSLNAPPAQNNMNTSAPPQPGQAGPTGAPDPLVKPTAGSAGASTGLTPPTPPQNPGGGGPADPNVNISQVGAVGNQGTQDVTYKPPKAGEPGSTLQNPGNITESGKLYTDRVAQGLKGEDPTVKNAQATEDTAKARRDYQSRTATQEGLAQTPFAQGSAQYQRAMDRAQSGVDMANQSGQNSVNDYTRKRTEDNMNRARDVEQDAYGNAIGERNYKDIKANTLINSLPKGKASSMAQQMASQGKTAAEITAALYGPDGKLKPEFVDDTQGTNDAKARLDKVTSTFKPGMVIKDKNGNDFTVPGTGPDDPAYTNWAQGKADEQGVSSYGAITTPVTEADDLHVTKELTKKISGNTGKFLTDNDFTAAVEKKLIPDYTTANIPIDSAAQALIGKTVSIGGKQFMVVQSGRVANDSGGHVSYTVIKNPESDKVQYSYNGKLNDDPPRTDAGKDASKYAVFVPDPGNPNSGHMEYKASGALMKKERAKK